MQPAARLRNHGTHVKHGNPYAGAASFEIDGDHGGAAVGLVRGVFWLSFTHHFLVYSQQNATPVVDNHSSLRTFYRTFSPFFHQSILRGL